MNKKTGCIGIVLAGVLALSCITVPAAEKNYTEQTRIGNISADSNGTIGIDDATLLQRILAEVVAGDAWKRDACTKRTMDVNLDDAINIQDVTELQRYLAELPTSYIGSTVRAVYGGQVTYPDTYAQRMLQNTVNKYHFEGVACVVRNGELAAFSATGTADSQTGAPTNTKSRFCVGSLSKQFTAAAVMLLQERGALRTDDLLSQYFPECPYGNKVTLRQMLKMRSGIAEFYEESDDGYNINELPVGSLKNTLTNNGTTQQNRELLQSWLFAQPLKFTPGSKCVYCNSNYFLLARLVEKVSGMPYETFVTQNILQPLGMTETCFIDEGLRYNDIIRWKIAEKVLPVTMLGLKYNEDDTSAQREDLQSRLTTEGGMYKGQKVCDQADIYVIEEAGTRSFNPARDYYYPIPTYEIATSEGSVVQNPGW